MFVGIMLAVLYVVVFLSLGLATFRKGHYFLFWVGIIFPLLWIIGALMAPKSNAQEAAAR